MADRFPNDRRPNEYENMSLLDAVNLMVQRSGLPEKAIASIIGKALSTLQRELRPEDEGAKLGVETLLPLVVACCGPSPEEAPEPLIWICHRLGFEPHRFGYAEPDAPTVDRECLQSVQAMAVAHKLMMEETHPDIVAAALDRAKVELDQDLTSYTREWNVKRGE